MNPNTLRKIKRLEAGESFITSEPGNSMLPLYKSNEKHLVTPIKWEDCKVGDVVFCKVRGSCVTHKVYAVDSGEHNLQTLDDMKMANVSLVDETYTETFKPLYLDV